MKDQEFKEIGADTLPQLLAKANNRGVTKEQVVQIVQIGKEFHMVYVE